MAQAKMEVSRIKWVVLIIIAVGISAILLIDIFLASLLFSVLDPFLSSIIIEVIITAIIVGAAWSMHTKFLKTAV